MFGMGTGGSSLPSSPLWLYISRSFNHVTYTNFFFATALHRNNLLYTKINNYTANSYYLDEIFLYYEARRNYSFFLHKIHSSLLSIFPFRKIETKPFDLLVSVSYTLLHLHLRPINLVVFKGSYLKGDTLS